MPIVQMHMLQKSSHRSKQHNPMPNTLRAVHEPAEPAVEVLAALVAAAAVAVAGVLLQRRRRCESARDGSPR